MHAPLTVVLSQGQSQHPDKRKLEEDIAAALLFEPGIGLAIVPHLYDLTEDHTGMLFLSGVKGDLVVLSWIFPRAARWALHRAGIRGLEGTTLLPRPDDAHDEEDWSEQSEADETKDTIGPGDVPNRRIYLLDLRDHDHAQPYLDEVRRIAGESRVQPVAIDLAVVSPTSTSDRAQRFLDTAGRRWYPVIDFSRCTNCMECIDFCLFGVYGVDRASHIVVEQPDNCRKGCPACSRVCPENAIIFPMHKTPSIAGAPGEGPGALKIDLSKLFGAPDAIDLAALERDSELVRAGREAVGLTIGIPKRQPPKVQGPKDDLDKLMDELEEIAL
jgi:hypothetical protein